MSARCMTWYGGASAAQFLGEHLYIKTTIEAVVRG